MPLGWKDHVRLSGQPALPLECAVQSAVDPVMATARVDSVGYIVKVAWDAKNGNGVQFRATLDQLLTWILMEPR